MIAGISVCMSCCDINRFPDYPENADICIRLHYETEMTSWTYEANVGRDITQDHESEGDTPIGSGDIQTKEAMTATGMDDMTDMTVTDMTMTEGYMRYVIRAYPLPGTATGNHPAATGNKAATGNRPSATDNKTATGNQSAAGKTNRPPTQLNFVFIRDIRDGYDASFEICLPHGEYELMVWSDMIREIDDEYFYDVAEFAEVSLTSEYEGSTGYRDAYRGKCIISTQSASPAPCPSTAPRQTTAEIIMERPLARYEFITDDLKEFINDEANSDVDLTGCRVIFHYADYLPSAYNMNTYRPVDSRKGVAFESEMRVKNEHEAALGFDYVFISNRESSISVQIGIYDGKGRQLVLTSPIEIPLKRGFNTIVRGPFLTQKASGGIVINPDFDGNHNIIYGLNSNQDEK